MLAPEFYQPLRDMGTHYHAKAQAIAAAEELMKLLDYQLEENAQTPDANSTIQTLDWHAGLKMVAHNFTVKSHSGSTLVGPLSFQLNNKQHIAIVGPSGAGKSSL